MVFIPTKADIWCAISKSEESGGGYCTHAFNAQQWDHVFTEEQRTTLPMRAICGTKVAELPGTDMTEEGWLPGCQKCQKKLVKMKLITEEVLKV